MPPHLPKISVVMPVRDGGGFLDAAIASVCGQSLADFEFLIIDDGSLDGTPGILEKRAGDDSRIRLLNSGGAGIVAALNLGMAEARGTYIARMDADDIALPGRLELQAAFMEANGQTLACGTAVNLIDASGRNMPTDMPSHSGTIGLPALLAGNPFIHPTMMIRRDALTASGLYRTGCTYAEDYDLWLRLAASGPLAVLPETTLQFRRHSGQTSSVKRLSQRAATALARQAAIRRMNGRDEGADLSLSLGASVRQFLQTRVIDRSPIAEQEGKDLLIMARFAQRGADRQSISLLESRIRRETTLRKVWLLPVWYRLDRLKI